jgi:hypothetical protein
MLHRDVRRLRGVIKEGVVRRTGLYALKYLSANTSLGDAYWRMDIVAR